jgi:hypothetical protein
MESGPRLSSRLRIFFDARSIGAFNCVSVSGGEQSRYHSRSWLNQEGGILSRELFSSSVIFFVCFEIVDLLFTIAGIDINKLTITPNANVDISTKAKEPSNFQIRKVTPTGIGFCNAKMTVKMASPNATISNNCIARSSFEGTASILSNFCDRDNSSKDLIHDAPALKPPTQQHGPNAIECFEISNHCSIVDRVFI